MWQKKFLTILILYLALITVLLITRSDSVPFNWNNNIFICSMKLTIWIVPIWSYLNLCILPGDYVAITHCFTYCGNCFCIKKQNILRTKYGWEFIKHACGGSKLIYEHSGQTPRASSPIRFHLLLYFIKGIMFWWYVCL